MLCNKLILFTYPPPSPPNEPLSLKFIPKKHFKYNIISIIPKDASALYYVRKCLCENYS